MKSFILILLFLCVGIEADQDSSLEFSSSNFTAETQDYGKSFVYEYFVEPIVSLDEKFESIIAHCSVLGKTCLRKFRLIMVWGLVFLIR